MFQIFIKENDIFLTFALKFLYFSLSDKAFTLYFSLYSFTFTPAINVALGIT
jgi:hypothetical protein